ncbi:MAG: DUF1015 domain-containing protein [Spirochaetota bacterium]
MRTQLAGFGVIIPEICLPGDTIDLERWSVLACDQHTSEPDYWERVRQYVGDAPSALHCIIPEAYLDSQDVNDRVTRAQEAMRKYLRDETIRDPREAFMLVRRTLSDGSVRNGLVVALDLEHYDYSTGADTLIRATEKTIVERIPPRMMIRDGAPLELPHVLVMVDDPDGLLIEPLAAKRTELQKAYSTSLMFGGGSVEGRLVSAESEVEGILAALTTLADPARSLRRYGSENPVLFPVGDGNHSLAAAKRYWETRKAQGSDEHDPARYAMVELVNLHGPGLPFKPIHRTILGRSAKETARALERAGFTEADDTGTAEPEVSAGASELKLRSGSDTTRYRYNRTDTLVVTAVDGMLQELEPSKIDYIHGTDAIDSALRRGETVIELPPLARDKLIPTVIEHGALPRKAFSLGRSEDKRYYLEARRLQQ